MSMSYFFSGLGNFTFSIRKIAIIKNITKINSFINTLKTELPKLGRLLYLSCILFDLI